MDTNSTTAVARKAGFAPASAAKAVRLNLWPCGPICVSLRYNIEPNQLNSSSNGPTWAETDRKINQSICR